VLRCVFWVKGRWHLRQPKRGCVDFSGRTNDNFLSGVLPSEAAPRAGESFTSASAAEIALGEDIGGGSSRSGDRTSAGKTGSGEISDSGGLVKVNE
jgi:hypothetical protein